MNDQPAQITPYCQNRARDRLGYVFLGLLLLFLGVCVAVYGVSLLGEDRSGWDYMEYVKMGVGCLGGLALVAAGVAECYLSVRDAFWPGKSTIANSIRSQLPRPEEAPDWRELFAMVDRDLAATGRWFGKVGIGSQWMLGDQVSCLARIRGVFKQDEIRNVGGKPRRLLGLMIVDDRKQAQVTSFQDPRDLDAVVQCLRLRVPAAHFGNYQEYIGYCDRPDDEWDRMEREFQQRQAKLAQRAAQAPVPARAGQGFVLTDYPSGRRTSQVSREGLVQRLEQLEPGQQFKLELTPPIPAGFKEVSATITEELVSLNCVREGSGALWLVAQLQTSGNGSNKLPRGFAMAGAQKEEVLAVLTALVEKGQVPDLFGPGWQAVQLQQSQQPQQQSQGSAPFLNLTDRVGASRKYDRFSRRDVELAAQGLAEGNYREAILWLPPRLIVVETGDKSDARASIQISTPDGGVFRTRSTKTSPRQAGDWLLGCLEGRLPDGFQQWKDITREMEKKLERSEKKNGKK